MTAPDADFGESGSKRFVVALFIIHPTLSPSEISAALGLDAHFIHPVGEQRKTPKGALLPGVYRDTVEALPSL